MKRIEFIAPVKSMRGNFGSRQSLVYAPDDNRAFDSIPGQLNPALNYEPRLIGARAKRNYFCVKTKSSVRLTTPAMNAMAGLGGVGAIYSALVRNKMTQVYVDAYACYQDALTSGFVGTFRKYMYGYIKQALDNKSRVISIVTENHSVSIDNPWVAKNAAIKISVSKEILAKFWFTLASNPIEFSVGGMKGIAHAGDTFWDLMYFGYNVLNVHAEEPMESEPYMMMNGEAIINSNGNYVGPDDVITPNEAYELTPDLPV